MSVSSINPNSTSSAANTTSTSQSSAAALTNPKGVLNQADFLQLLVAQIQYQDPMNPQSDTQMAAQMAQFSTLQQTTQSTASLAMMQANSLIGSNVNLQVDSQHTASGLVTGVQVNSGSAQIMVNGTGYNLSQVISVTPPSTASTSSTSSTGSSSTAGSSGSGPSVTGGTDTSTLAPPSPPNS